MKKILSIVFALFLMVGVVGCSGSSTKDVAFDQVNQNVKDALITALEKGGVAPAKDEQGNPTGYEVVDLKTGGSPFMTFNVDASLIEAGTMYKAMMMTQASQVILLKAASSENVEALKKVLETEQEAQIGLWQTYLPDQFELVQKTTIKTNGNYLIYVTQAESDAIIKAFDQSFK